METQVVALDQARAQELYEEYRQHRQYGDAVDREIERAYRLIAKGKTVIQALKSITDAGLGDDRLPKLAIAGALWPRVILSTQLDGTARFQSPSFRRYSQTRCYFHFPNGSFPGIATIGKHNDWRGFESIVPLIPVKHRPRQALDQYHILFEAEWRPSVPADPMLIRRIGGADLWLVVAAWDLTEVERAVLASRALPQ